MWVSGFDLLCNSRLLFWLLQCWLFGGFSALVWETLRHRFGSLCDGLGGFWVLLGLLVQVLVWIVVLVLVCCGWVGWRGRFVFVVGD